MAAVPGSGPTLPAQVEVATITKRKRVSKSWKELGRKENRRDRSKRNEKRRQDRAAARAKKLQV